MVGNAQRPSLRRWIIFAAIALPVVAFVLPPLINTSRYQHRIADSIGRSIGRQVHISSVRLRLLPLPGFEFSGFSVQEDPAFGAEPILHSDSVVAYLRLLSLWRGKLEVSRIHFDDASLNLVREPNGGWNFASVLVQAAHIPNAPTSQRYAGSSPRFPYIEAENTRINFKQGNEKMPLSFINSDLSISLAPGEEWELHFRAQPVRTDLDLDLADTGVLRIDGTLQRASLLAQMPLKLAVQWSGVPLGQLSRLTTGSDLGWRGGLSVEAEVRGTAELAQISSQLRIAGLHRAEFSAAHPLDVATSCHASFRKASRSIEAISCASPVGEGGLLLTGSIPTGSIDGVETLPQAQLTLAIHRVPAAAVLAALEQVRSGVGAGVQAAGALDGHFAYAAESGHLPSISGEMSLDSLTLTSPDAAKPFVLAPVRVRCESAMVSGAASPVLLLQPVRLPMGAPVPLTVDGRFTKAGFNLHFTGASSLARVQVFSKAFQWLGTRSARQVALGGTGTATLDLEVHGTWLDPIPDSENPAAAVIAEGNMAIRNAELTTPYLAEPLRIALAQAILRPGEVTWTNATFSYGKVDGQGTLDYPTSCLAGAVCAGRFTLMLPTLDLAALQSALLGTSERGEFLRQLLDRIDRRSMQWPGVSGTVQVGTLSIGKLVVHDALGAVDIEGNSIRVRSLNGHFANATAHLVGKVDASLDPPEYRFDVQMTNAAPSALANLFEERWGSGAANLSAQLKMSGYDAGEFARSASGTLHWDWTKGGLVTEDPLPVEAEAFVHFDEWSGDATIADQTITIAHSLMARGDDALPLSGTISFARELDLKAGSAAHTFTVTGTLQHPEVKAITEEAKN